MAFKALSDLASFPSVPVGTGPYGHFSLPGGSGDGGGRGCHNDKLMPVLTHSLPWNIATGQSKDILARKEEEIGTENIRHSFCLLPLPSKILSKLNGCHYHSRFCGKTQYIFLFDFET